MSERVHHDLLKQLDGPEDRPIQAIVQLRSPRAVDVVPSPEEAGTLAAEVLGRVQARVGRSALRTNVLRNLSSVIVEASPAFVRSLLEQPEVVSAVPNRAPAKPGPQSTREP